MYVCAPSRCEKSRCRATDASFYVYAQRCRGARRIGCSSVAHDRDPSGEPRPIILIVMELLELISCYYYSTVYTVYLTF